MRNLDLDFFKIGFVDEIYPARLKLALIAFLTRKYEEY